MRIRREPERVSIDAEHPDLIALIGALGACRIPSVRSLAEVVVRTRRGTLAVAHEAVHRDLSPPRTVLGEAAVPLACGGCVLVHTNRGERRADRGEVPIQRDPHEQREVGNRLLRFPQATCVADSLSANRGWTTSRPRILCMARHRICCPDSNQVPISSPMRRAVFRTAGLINGIESCMDYAEGRVTSDNPKRRPEMLRTKKVVVWKQTTLHSRIQRSVG